MTMYMYMSVCDYVLGLMREFSVAVSFALWSGYPASEMKGFRETAIGTIRKGCCGHPCSLITHKLGFSLLLVLVFHSTRTAHLRIIINAEISRPKYFTGKIFKEFNFCVSGHPQMLKERVEMTVNNEAIVG